MFPNISPRQAVAVVAVAVPTVYLLLLRRSVMLNVESCVAQQCGRGEGKSRKAKTQTASASEPAFPLSLPQPVSTNETTDYVLWNERVVSKPVALSELRSPAEGPDELLTRYVRGTMVAFTWTPQAYLMRKMLPDSVRETFGADYINAVDFKEVNQRVDGVYTVQYRGTGPCDERVEMRLSPPEGYTGPRSDGIIVAAIEPAERGSTDAIVFINETWLWRNANEKPTLLEGFVGRWFHSFLAAWLIEKGTKAIQQRHSVAKT